MVGFGASVQGSECGAGAIKWPPLTNSRASASAAAGIGGAGWLLSDILVKYWWSTQVHWF